MPTITQLPALVQASVVPGTDVLAIVNGGATKKVTAQALVNSAAAALAPQGGTLALTGAMTVSSTLGVTGQARFAAGSAATPSISFTGDPDTGFYSFSANAIGFSFGGVSYGGIGASGMAYFAPIQAAGSVSANYTTAIPAGGTAGAGFLFSSATNFGVFFGSGAPTLSAAKGSLYLRSDGSGTTDRAYINSNGSTTWTALTTVA